MNKGKEAPIKSVTICGNLSKSVTYKLCPSNEFSEGVWNISVSSLLYKCNIPNFHAICEVSCNLSKAQRFNKFSEVELYQQPFGIFVLDSQGSTKVKLGYFLMIKF